VRISSAELSSRNDGHCDGTLEQEHSFAARDTFRLKGSRDPFHDEFEFAKRIRPPRKLQSDSPAMFRNALLQSGRKHVRQLTRTCRPPKVTGLGSV
jgi:hypothetical protein